MNTCKCCCKNAYEDVEKNLQAESTASKKEELTHTNDLDWSVRAKKRAIAYTSNTSLHGIQYTTTSDSSNVRRKRISTQHTTYGSSLDCRVIWTLLVMAMFAYLTYTIVILCNKYLSYEHKTFVRVERRRKIEFPAITICLKASFDPQRFDSLPWHSQAVKDYLMSLSEHENLLNKSLNWSDPKISAPLKNLTFEEILNELSFQRDDIFVPLDETIVKAFLPTNELDSRCFAYNTAYELNEQPLEKSEQESLEIILRIPGSEPIPEPFVPGIKVSVHSPYETPSPFSWVDISAGSLAQFHFTVSKYRFLPAPYKSFNNRNCLDTETPEFRSPLRLFHHYTWANCFMEIVYKHIINTCNCTYEKGGNLRECTIYDREMCVKKVSEKVLRESLSEEGAPECLEACTHVEFQTKWSSVPFPHNGSIEKVAKAKSFFNESDASHFILLKMKIDSSHVITREHLPAMTADDIYSTLGGQMGLFMGASLLTVTEALELFLFCIWGSLVQFVTWTRARVEC